MTIDDNIFFGGTGVSVPYNVKIGTLRASMTDTLEKKVKELEDLFFRKVIVKCSHCGQWGAAMCACKYCGSPIDMGEVYATTR
jgi:hypothetical protein